ncbi:hypothetical protein ACEW7V_00805 [Areca yellow leaf disease phytoplasma]|uniref:hypothetical protein n=1 Tax=Areca yellow leaf disease phytoplasma TaxID=927614 RepID=UPI0035B50EF5
MPKNVSKNNYFNSFNAPRFSVVNVQRNGRICQMQSQTLDLLSRHNIQAHVLVKDLDACFNDYEKTLKLMLIFLKPQYIIPVMGEYRHQYQVQKLPKV